MVHPSLGSPHERQRGADRIVGHRKELFLWPLAFECGNSIFSLRNGVQGRQRTDTEV